MSELKPCPFCGGGAELRDGRMEFFVRCSNCKPFPLVVYGKSVRELDHIEDEKEAEAAFDAIDWDDIKQSAIDAWNNRPYENKIKAEAVRESIVHSVKTDNHQRTSYQAYEIMTDYANKLERGEV